MACVNGWHSDWRRGSRYPNGYFLERIYCVNRWASLCRNAGKEVEQNMTTRPEKNDMRAFEWIYWELLDKQETRLAEAVQSLISHYHSAVEEANWHARRRFEIEAELEERDK
jgi:hypothetical protein